jgi:hypothetical protein
MNKMQFSKYIKEFDFKNLFINLGWDNFNNDIPISINGAQYNLKGIAQKRGFAIVACLPQADGKIPLNDTRKKIENCLRKIHQEHLIIYYDPSKQEQKWQFVIEETDKPKRVREIPYHITQDTEILYQRARGLLFDLEEEDKLTLVDVTSRVRENLAKNSEKVTKKFYSQFKKHYNSFLGFIEGIDDLIKDNDNKDKQWYASIMMNRLMFCYFIQKRGYLDNDINYLQNKLKEVRKQAGKDQFYLFYRQFLLKLFHQGLGMPQSERKLDVELGNIPYLNGGLFDVHELEKKFPDIQIRDEAFEKIFHFFDQWNWHLDTRIEASGKDINPDVIGYIFEKYVNDRAAMGAYYTKEDITDYISKNTIIPSLFDKVKERYPVAFQENGYIWTFLKNSGDTYIYDAVKKGIDKDSGLFDDLPEDIKKGFDPELEQNPVNDEEPHLFEIRKTWNKKAPEEIALPTETYRELIERRKRYAEIKNKIEQGEIAEINDLITYNLNIRQFTQDILENTDDPDLILAFFKVIVGNIKYKESNENIVRPISILDPTCGSGAFLFAAMNILEPIYEACIEKMEQFTSESPRKYKFFHKVLSDISTNEHPNLKYYIYKSIILNNLYGVDIMHEAVEIAKLRLFLKMIGAVDVDNTKPNYGLEPLPDIDFNIKAGNTLVGFASFEDLKNSQKGRLDLFQDFKIIDDNCNIVSIAYKNFQSYQLLTDKGTDEHRKAKSELQERLDSLNDKLNGYLATNCGITKYEDIRDRKNLFNSEYILKQQTKKYKKWLETHQPFHWFAEFYDIINENGGFDVIIGNPPYIELNKIKKQYTISNDYLMSNSGNIYSMIVERCLQLKQSLGNVGMIVPISIISVSDYFPLKNLIIEKQQFNVFANFSVFPSKLFTGVAQRLTIFISNHSSLKQTFASNYIKWLEEERGILFENLKLISADNNKLKAIPKIATKHEKKIFNSLKGSQLQLVAAKGSNIIYYHRSPNNFIRSHNYLPFYKGSKGELLSKDHLKILYFRYQLMANGVVCLLMSNLFFWHYEIIGNCRNLTYEDINNFPICNNKVLPDIAQSVDMLMCDMQKNAKRKVRIQKKTGKVYYDEYYIKKSKKYIDKIDTILSKHYGFTEEELDFIINYDIKYRMGEELKNHIYK